MFIQPNTRRGAAVYYHARRDRHLRFTHNGMRATGTLTLTGNPADTETVVIYGRTYTFQATLTNANGNVLIGADASESLDNLVAAINGGAGAGTLYAAATPPHTFVAASPGAGDTLTVRARISGVGGNSLTTTDTLADGSWGAGTLTGGVSP